MPQTTPPVLVTTSTASILTAVMSVDVTPAMRGQELTAKVLCYFLYLSLYIYIYIISICHHIIK